MSDATPHPVQQKLAESSEATFSGTFVAPEAECFHFVMGMPMSVTSPDDLRGRLCVVLGTNLVYQANFTPEDVKECNWLDQVGWRGYILTWRAEVGSLDGVLRPGRSYIVCCELGHVPSSRVSLWLTYVQDWKIYRQSLKRH